MQITVKVRPEHAAGLQSADDRTRDADELAQTVRGFGVKLDPMHPGSEDPGLASYFIVEVPEKAVAERVLDALRSSAAVEAAYAKPADEAP